MGDAQQASKYQKTSTKRSTRPASKQESKKDEKDQDRDQDQDQALAADGRRQWVELDFAKFFLQCLLFVCVFGELPRATTYPNPFERHKKREIE